MSYPAKNIMVATLPADANGVFPCLVEACTEAEHVFVDGVQDEPCTALEVVHSEGLYSVTAEQYPGNSWRAYASLPVDVTAGCEGLDLLRGLVDDYGRVQAECDRLNAAVSGLG